MSVYTPNKIVFCVSYRRGVIFVAAWCIQTNYGEITLEIDSFSFIRSFRDVHHAILVLAYFSMTEILFSRLVQICCAGKKFRIVWKLSWTHENIFGAAWAFHSQWIPLGNLAYQIFRVLYTSSSFSFNEILRETTNNSWRGGSESAITQSHIHYL